MKFEIEVCDGTYHIEVDAMAYGADADSGADNPDDCYGYMDVEWTPLIGIQWDVYGNFINLTGEKLIEVAELHRDEIQASITEKFAEYAREYAEDAALDAVDREYEGYDYH